MHSLLHRLVGLKRDKYMSEYNELMAILYKLNVNLNMSVFAEGNFVRRMCENCKKLKKNCECKKWHLIQCEIEQKKLYKNISVIKLLILINKHKFVDIHFGISIPNKRFKGYDYLNCGVSYE